jgi:ABC-type Zn2+ transport system substrate-binding protein/surface adhesin
MSARIKLLVVITYGDEILSNIFNKLYHQSCLRQNITKITKRTADVMAAVTANIKKVRLQTVYTAHMTTGYVQADFQAENVGFFLLLRGEFGAG